MDGERAGELSRLVILMARKRHPKSSLSEIATAKRLASRWTLARSAGTTLLIVDYRCWRKSHGLDLSAMGQLPPFCRMNVSGRSGASTGRLLLGWLDHRF